MNTIPVTVGVANNVLVFDTRCVKWYLYFVAASSLSMVTF